MYVKDLNKPKYQFLIKKRVGIKHLTDPKAFIEYSAYMDDICNNINDYKPRRFVFDDIIADIVTNKKIHTIVKKLFVRCRKLNISLVFITQSYFSVTKKLDLILHIT